MFIIIDYGVGNLTSILNMLKKAGVVARISSDPAEIRDAGRILLPGMGHFDHCMQKLEASGLRPLIEEKVLVQKTPMLGICVGLQMLMRSSEEGKLPGLGWVPGETIRFRSDRMGSEHKVPHMGWLELSPSKPSPLLNQLEHARFYFAHSYHVQVDDPAVELMSAHYAYPFTVGVEAGNIVGVQFHPEKSHRFGMQFLKNFAAY